MQSVNRQRLRRRISSYIPSYRPREAPTNHYLLGNHHILIFLIHGYDKVKSLST
jgi:hypothetical protein